MTDWQTARLLTNSEPLADQAAVHREVLALGKAQGWLQSTDTVFARRGDDACWLGISGAGTGQQLTVKDFLLDGELCDANGSATFRHLGGSRWLWSTTREGPDGAACSATECRHICNWRPDGPKSPDWTLNYRVYWRQVDEQIGGEIVAVWRPWLARFVGFSQSRSL